MWRIGLMGHNARRDVAERVLTALDEVLAGEPELVRSA
jgi:aspartate aminotransferase-like enzyme